MNENKPIIPTYQIAFLVLFLIVLILFTWKIVFGESYDEEAQDKTIELIEKAIVANTEITWTQEMENKRLEALKPKKPVKVTPKVVKAKESHKETKPEVKSSTKITLSDKIQVVACLNEKNMTIHQPKNGNCYLGQGGKWKNILLPPKSHIEHFKKIFGNDYKYRLAIANFEGSFNEEAKNPYAIGYLQTLRTHKVKKDVVSQLNWLAKREVGTTGRICDKNNNAPYGWSTKLDRYTCMARWHYGFHKKDSKHYAHGMMYWKRYKVTTEYYLSLSF